MKDGQTIIFAFVYLWLEIVGTLQVHLFANFGCDRVRSESNCVQFFILGYDYEKTFFKFCFQLFSLFVDRCLHFHAWEDVLSNPGWDHIDPQVTSATKIPQEERLVFRQELWELHAVDGVEEDHLLLGALHPAARLHADRQLDHRLDRAEAKLVVGLFAQHRRADLKHGTKLPEEEKVGKLSQKGVISMNKEKW